MGFCLQKKGKKIKGWVCGSVVERLPSTYEGLRAILSTTKGAPLQGKKHFSEQIRPAPPADQAVVPIPFVAWLLKFSSVLVLFVT